MIASTRVREVGIALLTAVLVLVLLTSAGSRAQSPSGPAAVGVSKLRILYAGRPGSDREKDFVDFLKKHFDVVQTGNLETFKDADTQGFDVTLLDWDPDRFDGPRPRISTVFARPVITFGVTGGMICRQCQLKTGYL